MPISDTSGTSDGQDAILTSTRRHMALAAAPPSALKKLHSRTHNLVVHEAGLAPGYEPNPEFDLEFFGGRTIPNLSYRNYFLGGGAWASSDVACIDVALQHLMTDPGYNSILQQYFDRPVEAHSLGWDRPNVPIGRTFDRDSVDETVQRLLQSGKLSDLDLDTTVINLLLPSGIALSTDRAVAKHFRPNEPHQGIHSFEGLSGYHGSVHFRDDNGSDRRVYFTVCACSELLFGRPHGIPVLADPWKNVLAVLYHLMCEVRTDPDVDEAALSGEDRFHGWYAPGRGEIGDLPIEAAGLTLDKAIVEVKLANGKIVPTQLLHSNRVHGPEMA